MDAKKLSAFDADLESRATMALLQQLGTAGTPDAGPEVQLISAASLKPEAIRWIWPGWLAGGKFHILAGAPGCGKTTIALRMAATITRGSRWPDGSIAQPGSALIWSGEDDPADTLVPRLHAAGADVKRCFFVGDTKVDGQRRPFDPARDTSALCDAVASIPDLGLIIIDPVVSAVAGDSHKNAETRRCLQPLVDLAAATGAALIGITHLSKGTAGRNPTERVTGSLAFAALARVVLMAARITDEEGSESRIFCRSKSNIGEDSGGFEYSLEQSELADFPGVFASSVIWGNYIDGDARELMAEPASDGEQAASLDDAVEFLRGILADRPVPSREVENDARGAGHSWATVRRAQERLGIVPYKQGRVWYWALPAFKLLKFPHVAQPVNVSNIEQVEQVADEGEVF